MTKKTKYLIISLVFDAIGYLSYFIPVFGEGIDFVWAPLSAFVLTQLYKGTIGKVGGAIELIEEGLPFTDFIPTYTMLWIYQFVWKKDAIDSGVNSKESTEKTKEEIIDI